MSAQSLDPEQSSFQYLVPGGFGLFMLHCPDCGYEMFQRTIVTRLGNVDGWSCVSCRAFYRIKELKRAILTV
jgi:predicted RNA-binding Zn-ribbon protein involved in translation (DUF1610 family)